MNSFAKLSLAGFVLAIGAWTSSAQARGGYAERYQTTYEVWDNSVYETYGYEEVSYTSYSNCGRFRTCYVGWQRSDTVYVEETVVTEGPYNGYNRVRVYHDGYDGNPYCDYYVYQGRIGYRRYYVENVYYPAPFVTIALINMDWSGYDATARDLYITAGVAVDIGAEILNAGAWTGNQNEQKAGLISIGAGLLVSSVAAAVESAAEQKTALCKQVEADEAARKTAQADPN